MMYNKKMRIQKIKIDRIKEEVKLKVKDPRQKHDMKIFFWRKGKL